MSRRGITAALIAAATATISLNGTKVWLKVDADLLTEQARFSYSSNGTTWMPFGRPFTMAFQLKMFQGVQFALFHYNTGSTFGGMADFDFMQISEPHPRGLMQPIPVGRSIEFTAVGRENPLVVADQQRFVVEDRGLGRVALRTGTGYVSIAPTSDSTSTIVVRAGRPSDRETFQWMETFYGDVMLMSLETHRYLRIEADGRVSADSRGAEPDPNDGTALRWRIVRYQENGSYLSALHDRRTFSPSL